MELWTVINFVCMQLARAGWQAGWRTFHSDVWHGRGKVPCASRLFQHQDLVKFTWNCTRVLYEYYEYYDPDKIERYRIWSVNWTLNCHHLEVKVNWRLTKVWWTLTRSEVLDVRIKFSCSNPTVRRGVWPSALCQKVNVRWRTSYVSSVQKSAGRFTTRCRCRRRYCCSYALLRLLLLP